MAPSRVRIPPSPLSAVPAAVLRPPAEGWQSGRMRRSRKPLSVVRRIEGSNPSPSAHRAGSDACDRVPGAAARARRPRQECTGTSRDPLTLPRTGARPARAGGRHGARSAARRDPAVGACRCPGTTATSQAWRSGGPRNGGSFPRWSVRGSAVERSAGGAEGRDEHDHCVERGGQRFGVALNLSEQESALKRGKRGKGELARIGLRC
jgi:hypothetical protein